MPLESRVLCSGWQQNHNWDPVFLTFLGTRMLDEGDSLAAGAVARFLGPQSKLTITPVSQGFSGGSVYRCDATDGSYALKLWPTGTSSQRVDEVHAIQRFASKSLAILPSLRSLGRNRYRLTLESTHVELSTWMPGSAFNAKSTDELNSIRCLSSRDFSKKDLFVNAAVSAGAAAIARFHEVTHGLGTERSAAPAISQRLKRLGELRHALPRVLADSRHWCGPAQLAVEKLRRDWPRLHNASELELQPWLHKAMPVQWVLRDIHREHILFENERVSGIVDFDAVRRDTVATDLARWVGSFADLDVAVGELWPEAIAGYTSVREISTCEQQLSSAIERASWYIHLANWVTWIAGKSQDIPGGIEAAQGRVSALLRRSDVWTSL
jgi:Ser/Thr protein kinase RdoA (MazF antagonist)